MIHVQDAVLFEKLLCWDRRTKRMLCVHIVGQRLLRQRHVLGRNAHPSRTFEASKTAITSLRQMPIGEPDF